MSAFLRDPHSAMTRIARFAAQGHSNFSPTFSNVTVSATLNTNPTPAVYATQSVADGGLTVVGFVPRLSNYVERIDATSNLDSTGVFEAPTDGIYMVNFGANFTSLNDGLSNGYVMLRSVEGSNTLGALTVNAAMTSETISTSTNYVGRLRKGQAVCLAASNAVLLPDPAPCLSVCLLHAIAPTTV